MQEPLQHGESLATAGRRFRALPLPTEVPPAGFPLHTPMNDSVNSNISSSMALERAFARPPRLALRLLEPGDSAAFVDLYVKAPSKDRISRFCGGVSENFARTYAERAMTSATELLGLFEDGLLRAAVEVYVDNQEAELAFLVAPDAQCRGMGSMLMAAGLSVAHERGACNALVVCSYNNAAMHQVARVNGLKCKVSNMEWCAELRIDQECDAHFPSIYQLQHALKLRDKQLAA